MMNDPHFNVNMYKPPGIDTPMTGHTVIKTAKKPKEPKATNKANKPNRKSSGDESSHVTSTSNVVLTEKIEKEENPTTSLIRRRPPLVTRLSTLEQNQFYQRKATPQIMPRGKSAWDYVLEEASWMAIDFRQELRWKVGFAKGVGEACSEKIEKTSFERTFLGDNKSSEITDTLKAVANNLSKAVAMKFAEFEARMNVPLNSSLESKSETPSTPSKKQEKSSEIQPLVNDFEILVEKGLGIPSLTLDPSHQVSFPPVTTFIQQHQIDYNYLLKHQQIICKDISRLSKLGFGTVVYGASYSGKTVALIYTILSWLQVTAANETEISSPTILIFGLQKCLLRWLFLLQSIVGHCCRFVLCHQQEWTELPLSSSLKNALSENQVKFCSIPQIVLVDGEDFESFFFLHFHDKIKSLQGVIVDVRGYATKISPTSIGPQNTAADALLTASPVLTGFSTSSAVSGSNNFVVEKKNKILLHLAETLPSTQANRIIVTDENFRLIDRFSTLSFLLPGATLTDLIRKFQPSSLLSDPPVSMLPSPMKESDNQSPSIQLPQDPHIKNTLNQLLINLSVHATIPSDLNTRAYAQIREEVISTELTFTQQKKYDEIAQVLMKSGYYDGSDMDKFARITTLLKMICFHSQLVSIKRVPNTSAGNGNGDAPQYSFLSYRPSSSASAGSSSNFVPNTASSSSSTSSSVVASANSVHGPYHAQGYVSNMAHSSYIGGGISAGNSINTTSAMGHYQHTHGSMNGNGITASNMNNSAAKVTATNHVYFSPGPLIYKLHHDPSSLLHHQLPESYLHDGSNKLKILKTLLHRFEGLRVVLVAGNWLELYLIHNYLEQHHINHLYPHYYLKNGQHHVSSSSSMTATFPPTSVANKASSSGHDESAMNSPSLPEAFNEYFYHQDRFYWLGEENNIQLFNDPSVLSSILLTSLSAFKSPSMSPWLADAVILLSHEWDQYCEIKNCFRLRLLKAGPRGDPVTIIRVSSKNTIEEVMLRQKTGLPQLQGMKLMDLNLIQKNNHHSHSHHGSNLSGVSSSHDSSNVSHEIDYSSGFITNITFLKSIPLMHVPNKNFNSALPGASVVGAGTVYHHSTPVSPLGLTHSHSASFDMRASPTMGELESQNNSGSEGNNTIGGASIPPRRGSGKGLILVNPPGKMPFLKDGNTPVVASASSNTNTSLAGWSNRSNLMTSFQDDTLIPYSSITPSHLAGTTSSRLSTPLVKIDKQAVQKWLDTYRQALYYNYIEFIQPLSSSLQSNQSNSDEPHYLTTPSSQSLTFFEQRIQAVVKQYPYFMILEKQIIHNVYLFFYQRYLRLSSPVVSSSASSSVSLSVPTESSSILPDTVDATSIYLERDYSHEISWYLSLYRNAVDSMEEKIQQSKGDGLARLMSNIERLRLSYAGYGKSEKESKLLKLLLPLPPVTHHHNHHHHPAQASAVGAVSTLNQLQSETLSVVSSTVNAAETTTINGSIVPATLSSAATPLQSTSNNHHHHHHHHRPSVYQHFHDSLQEAMRLGLTIEPWLYNNPLQAASRYDDVTIPSYEHDLFNPDYSVKIKYMHANYNSNYNNYATANANGSAVNGGSVGGSASGTTTTKSGGNGRRKSNANSSNATISSNMNAPGFTSNPMNNSGMPMEYSDLQPSLSYGGGISDNTMGKRDIIGGVGNPSNINNTGANRSYYSAPNEAGMKRGYDAVGGQGTGYYGASSAMPSIKDEGDPYNQEKRRKMEYNGGMYGYDRGVPSGNPPGSLTSDNSYQSSYLPNYSSGVHHHHPPPHTTTIGGMILPASSVQGYGAPSTGSTNPSNTSYSFDLNQQKLLLSESNLTAVTPNANMYSNNMMYDGSNNMISHDPNNPNLNNGGPMNRSMSYGGNNTNSNPSYYNTNTKISGITLLCS